MSKDTKRRRNSAQFPKEEVKEIKTTQDIGNFPNRPLPLAVPSFDLFNERSSYIFFARFYFAVYGQIPCIIQIDFVDARKAEVFFTERYKDKITSRYYKKNFVKDKKDFTCDDVFYTLGDMLLINFDMEYEGVSIAFNGEAQEQLAHEFAREMQQFFNKKKKVERHIFLVVQGEYGLSLRALPNKTPKMLVSENYNDDLALLHPLILENLRKKNHNGLFLLYGAPGTGKSTYIRYLIGKITNKKVIFLSPRIAGNLDSPSFTELLLDNPESVIVIEDAESLLVSRDEHRSSDLSVLLNLTDGILGTNLSIQFICTFNTQLNNIDPALARKGRLSASYEFKPLETGKANALLQKIGIADQKVTEPTTLADLYNIQEQTFGFAGKIKKIGF
jgi:hypothetical protein